MLTVTSLTNAEYVLSSVALGIDEYYTGVGEAPGVWAGSWAKQLGLVGMVEADELRALIEGNDPSSQVRLLTGRERAVKAFDLTFSAPKSVSLLWALGSEPVADVVAAAHREAVAAALGFLEGRAALARVQVDGVRRHVPTAGWAVAGFVHRTSRAGDPQLHTHCVVPNVVCREDGRCVAIAARPMFVWARAAGSVYQAELQRLLGLRLGVRWQPDRHNTREIAGFDAPVLRAFSKRTVEIEAELAASGALYESPALRMRADDEASLATRPAKDHRATPQMLCGRWLDEAASLGLPVGRDLDTAVCWRDPPGPPLDFEEIARRLVDEETGLCAHGPRFAEHDVIEHVAALAAGRLTLPEIVAVSDRFLASYLVCRLTPKATGSGWEPPRWSTVAQRSLEDETLALLDRVGGVAAKPIDRRVVDAALARAGLGDDQAAAVRTLCGLGGAVRAVLAPAGYGKTAMAHVAAACAAADGRPVVAVATTAKAVAELDAAGLPARTIAAFGLDVRRCGLAAGTVVVLDEISQTSTRDAHTVLSAVADCLGGQLWILGDPLQAPAVKAGGFAAEIAARTAEGLLPAAELTVNRRQVDAIDRHALDLLRGGEPAASQAVRREHGWEHTGASPEETRAAMADAVAGDAIVDGPENSVALAVSHTQAEDLADRIRIRLTTAGLLDGPALTGPGWTTDRDYRAGDRLLLHTRYGDRSSPLVNGTTGTITVIDRHMVTFTPDEGRPVVLPAGFVTGTRADGSPNVSHAWARTVDGAQGGTWQHAHLLGTAALDAYRGYTAQSRSQQPTHTWNTATIPTVDFGGRLAHEPDPDEQVAAALARVPDTTMAAVDDPWVLDRQLCEIISSHQAELDRQPPDRQIVLRAAQRDLDSSRAKLVAADHALVATRQRLDDLGPFTGLTREGRARRRRLDADLDHQGATALNAAGDVTRADERVRQLRREQAAHDDHERANGWRRPAIAQARDQLDQHWTDVALTCLRADQPLVHGVFPLRVAHWHLEEQLAAIDATIPVDRSRDLAAARRDLADATRRRENAERRVSSLAAELDQQTSHRWPRRNREAIERCRTRLVTARHDVSSQVDCEEAAQRRVVDVELHQAERSACLNATIDERRVLIDGLNLVDDTLDRTRPERVRQIVDDPTPAHLDLLGPVPASPTGRAVWCHQANELERHRDLNSSDEAAWRRLVDDLDQTPTVVAIAERRLPLLKPTNDPETWRRVTELAVEISESVMSRAADRPGQDVALDVDLGL